MRIAFIYLVHDDPVLTGRLIAGLTRHPDFDVFMHVDAKVDIDPFLSVVSPLQRAFVVKDRVEVHWAGFSQVVATIETLRYAFSHSYYDRIVVLQGGTYMLWSNEKIHAYFESLGSQELVHMSAPKASDFSNVHKYRLDWRMDATRFCDRISNLKTRVLYKGRIPLWSKPLGAPSSFGRIPIRESWAQVSLTGECALSLIDFYDSESYYNAYFSRSYAPDESYIPTFVAFSSFGQSTVENGEVRPNRNIEGTLNTTYFEYPDVVRTFSEVDMIPALQAKGFPFVRKVTSSRSEDFLISLDLQEP